MPELTQRQIAHLSDVSQATVSRVMNNDPRVDETVRERVLAIVRQHDYVPNARAQSLRGQKSGTLGLIVHRAPEELAIDPFFSALIVAILQVGSRSGYHLCVDTARTVASQRTIHEELLRTRRVDGLILVGTENDDERIARLLDGGFPFVLIGRHTPEEAIHSVDNDNIAAGEMIALELQRRGYQRIAYIGGPRGISVSEDRLTGCRNILHCDGNQWTTQFVAYSDFTESGGCTAMKQLLHSEVRPDAIIAVDDVTAVGAMRGARAHGLSIPDDMAFVGFNDSAFCAYADPPLSSVSIDITGLAHEATRTLIERIEQPDLIPSRRLIPCALVARASLRSV